ncbi:hypothetical protein ACOSQ3_013322 [Xanthoceras sorbifolium]
MKLLLLSQLPDEKREPSFVGQGSSIVIVYRRSSAFVFVMASGSCRFSTSGKNNRLFKINATATFMGSAFEIGSLVRDYISLKHIWDSIMMEKLGTMSVPGERLHQSVLIPWNGVPYKHAMACITKVRVDVENYVHDYLKKSTYLRTYSHYIHAIPDESLWPEVESETILPPKKRRSAGRPRLSRQRGAIEPAKVKRSVGFRCSKCKQVGHNSRTCLTYKTGGTSNVISARGRQRKRSRKGGVAAETSTAAVCSSTPTVTRVLWFPSNQQGTSSQGNANNEYFAS